MFKKLSDLVNTALNEYTLSLGDETNQPTFNKAEGSPELALKCQKSN